MAMTANFTNIKIMKPECLMSLQTDIRTDKQTVLRKLLVRTL